MNPQVVGSPCHSTQTLAFSRSTKIGTDATKSKQTNLHVVRALVEQLVVGVRLLAPDTDQAATAERTIFQANMIPLTDDTGRGRP